MIVVATLWIYNAIRKEGRTNNGRFTIGGNDTTRRLTTRADLDYDDEDLHLSRILWK